MMNDTAGPPLGWLSKAKRRRIRQRFSFLEAREVGRMSIGKEPSDDKPGDLSEINNIQINRTNSNVITTSNHTGVVKIVSDSEKIAFILDDDGTAALAYANAVVSGRPLAAGDRVTFDIRPGVGDEHFNKGGAAHAYNVRSETAVACGINNKMKINGTNVVTTSNRTGVVTSVVHIDSDKFVFILDDDGTAFFARASGVVSGRPLAAGDRVTFDILPGVGDEHVNKQAEAHNVRSETAVACDICDEGIPIRSGYCAPPDSSKMKENQYHVQRNATSYYSPTCSCSSSSIPRSIHHGSKQSRADRKHAHRKEQRGAGHDSDSFLPASQRAVLQIQEQQAGTTGSGRSRTKKKSARNKKRMTTPKPWPSSPTPTYVDSAFGTSSLEHQRVAVAASGMRHVIGTGDETPAGAPNRRCPPTLFELGGTAGARDIDRDGSVTYCSSSFEMLNKEKENQLQHQLIRTQPLPFPDVDSAFGTSSLEHQLVAVAAGGIRHGTGTGKETRAGAPNRRCPPTLLELGGTAGARDIYSDGSTTYRSSSVEMLNKEKENQLQHQQIMMKNVERRSTSRNNNSYVYNSLFADRIYSSTPSSIPQSIHRCFSDYGVRTAPALVVDQLTEEENNKRLLRVAAESFVATRGRGGQWCILDSKTEHILAVTPEWLEATGVTWDDIETGNARGGIRFVVADDPRRGRSGSESTCASNGELESVGVLRSGKAVRSAPADLLKFLKKPNDPWIAGKVAWSAADSGPRPTPTLFENLAIAEPALWLVSSVPFPDQWNKKGSYPYIGFTALFRMFCKRPDGTDVAAYGLHLRKTERPQVGR